MKFYFTLACSVTRINCGVNVLSTHWTSSCKVETCHYGNDLFSLSVIHACSKSSPILSVSSITCITCWMSVDKVCCFIICCIFIVTYYFMFYVHKSCEIFGEFLPWLPCSILCLLTWLFCHTFCFFIDFCRHVFILPAVYRVT